MSHLTLQLISHVTSVPCSFHRSHLDHARPTACQVGSASQRPSFGFLPSLSFLSTPPQLCTTPRHRPREPFHPLCSGGTRTSSRSKKLSVFTSVRENLPWLALEDNQLPEQHLPLPLHSGRHVAEFHVGAKPTQEPSTTMPRKKPLHCNFARVARHSDEEQSLSSPARPASSFACNCHREIMPARTCCIVAWPFTPYVAPKEVTDEGDDTKYFVRVQKFQFVLHVNEALRRKNPWMHLY